MQENSSEIIKVIGEQGEEVPAQGASQASP